MHRVDDFVTVFGLWATVTCMSACVSDFPEAPLQPADSTIAADASVTTPTTALDADLSLSGGEIANARDDAGRDMTDTDGGLGSLDAQASAADAGREDTDAESSARDGAISSDAVAKADALAPVDASLPDAAPSPPRPAPILTEVQLNSGTDIEDADGDSPPWVELFNPHDEPIELAPFQLRKDGLEDAVWGLPGITMRPRSFLLVFLSGKDRRNNANDLHASFTVISQETTLTLEDLDGSVRELVEVPRPTNEQQSWGVGMTRERVPLVDRNTPYEWRPIDGAILDAWYGTVLPFDDGNWRDHQGGLGIDGRPDASPADLLYRTISDSESDFSGFQGHRHWSYGSFRFRTGDAYRSGAFIPFPNEPALFGERNYFEAARNQWRWGDQQPALSLSIGSAGMTPSSTVDGEARGMVRRWKSPISGEIKITGTVNKPRAGGDGVNVSIHVNGEQRWATVLDANQLSTQFEVEGVIDRGQHIDFVVDPKNEADAVDDLVNLVAQIRKREGLGHPGPLISDSTDSWSMDGETRIEGWRFGFVKTGTEAYAYRRNDFSEFNGGEADDDTRFDPTIGHFKWNHGGDDGLAMDRWRARPTKDDESAYLPVRRWVSTSVGPHQLVWAATKSASGGDGATLRILVNDELLLTEIVGAQAGETKRGRVTLDNLEPDDTIDIVVDPRGENGDTVTADEIATRIQVFRLERIDQFVMPRDRESQANLMRVLGNSGDRAAFLRIPFDGSMTPTLYGGELTVRADDGFEVHLNGSMIASFGLQKKKPHTALLNRPRRWSPVASRFEVDTPVDTNNPASNVLILRVHDHTTIDEQFLAFAELDGFTAGVNGDSVGFLGQPSPNRPNWDTAGLNAGPIVTADTLWVSDARRDNPIDVDATITARLAPIAQSMLQITLGFGAPIAIPMTAIDDEGRYRATIPPDFVREKTLLRWKIIATDEEGRRTVFPSDGQTSMGTVPGIGPRDDFHVPVVVEPAPEHFDAEGASRAFIWLGGQLIENGWLIKRPRPGQTKPEISLLAADATMAVGFDPQLTSSLIDLRAPMNEPSGIRALAFNQLERDLVRSGTHLKPALLYRGNEYFGFYQLGLRMGWSETQQLGLGTSPSLFHFSAAPNETNAQIKNTTTPSGLLNSVSAQSALDALLNALRIPDDLENQNAILSAIDRYHLVNHLALRYLFRAEPCCGSEIYLGFNHSTGSWRLFPTPIDLSLGLFPPSPLGEPLRVAQHLLEGHDDEHLIKTLLDIPAFRRQVERRIRTLFDQYYTNAQNGRIGDTLERRIESFIAYESFMVSDRDRWPGYLSERTFRMELDAIERGALSILRQITDWVNNNVAVARFDERSLLPQADGQLTYRFFAPSDDGLGDQWTDPEFVEDQDWRNGNEAIGQSRGDLAEFITTLGAPSDGGTALFLRYTFEIDDPARFMDLEMSARYKDGFVAFLNGVEIARENYDGNITWDGRPSQEVGLIDAQFARWIELDEDTAQHLRAGPNVLAVAVFQLDPNDTELLFEIELQCIMQRPGTPGIPESKEGGDVSIFQVAPTDGNDDGGFIVIQNRENDTVDVSNWRVSGDGFEFMMPAGAVLLPNELMYIAERPTVLRRALNLGQSQIIGGVDDGGIPDIDLAIGPP